MKTVTTRKQAKQKGLSRYFTGKPCIRGCVAERYTSNGQCTQHTPMLIKSWEKENPDAVLAKQERYKTNSREKHLERFRRYRMRHLIACKEKDKRYAQNNKGIVNAKVAKRRASKLQATPLWVDILQLKQVYISCPKGMTVDHVIPLNNSIVCGLHVPWNLQYLTRSDNSNKSNKLIQETT